MALENWKKIRVALVGCGRIAKNHFKALGNFKDEIEVVAVCDPIPEARQPYEKLGVIEAFEDFHDMLQSIELDLVILCTPTGLHAKHAIAASKKGIHVVSEKPMATNIKDGIEMVKAAKAASKNLFVVKQNRTNPPLVLLKRAIDEGRFGAVKMVHINVFWSRPQSYYDQAEWRGTWEMDGGAFMNQASHYVDLLGWLFEKAHSVHAFTTRTREIEAEDTGVVNIKLKNGALASMAVTMLTFPKNLEGSITVLGETGSARIGGVAVNEIQVWDFETGYDYDSEIKDVNYSTNSIYGFGHPRYYKNVVDTILGKDMPHTDGESGLVSLELIEAIYRSAKTGKEVLLPLEANNE